MCLSNLMVKCSGLYVCKSGHQEAARCGLIPPAATGLTQSLRIVNHACTAICLSKSMQQCSALSVHIWSPEPYLGNVMLQCSGLCMQIWSSGKPPGVVRSPLQPEETRGLTRSDDLSRMLPFEAHLMAAGWPKNGVDQEGNEVVKEGSRPARLLHMVRRAERNLMSYERTGKLLTIVHAASLNNCREYAQSTDVTASSSCKIKCAFHARLQKD